MELIRNEQVSSFVVEDDTITLNLKTPIDGQSAITTTLADPEQFRLEMKDTLTAQVESGVMEYYHFVPEKSFSPYSLVLPLLLVGLVLLFVWAMFMSRSNSNNPLNNFGKARTVLGVPDGKKVTFDDVAGADEEKEELQQISNAELWLLGDGELREQMEEYALRLGVRDRVRFLGSQENVYLYLHDADVFVLPSRYEGMPMTVIEAMGTGLPIVASNVGGIPDMVEDGESGLLTTGAPEDVARCCAALLSDEKLRQRLGRRARAESERFSAEEMARSYCRVYES